MAKKTGIRSQISELLQSGTKSVSEIHEHFADTVSHGAISKTLQRMVNSGVIVRVERGKYARKGHKEAAEALKHFFSQKDTGEDISEEVFDKITAEVLGNALIIVDKTIVPVDSPDAEEISIYGRMEVLYNAIGTALSAVEFMMRETESIMKDMGEIHPEVMRNIITSETSNHLLYQWFGICCERSESRKT